MAKLSNELRRRRGTFEDHQRFTGAEGEITVVTTKTVREINDNDELIESIEPQWSLVVHDGKTLGGHAIPTLNQVLNQIESYPISLTNLSEDLTDRINEIDTKLSISVAETDYFNKSNLITEEYLEENLRTKINSYSSSIETLREELTNNTDENLGCNIIGFKADPNDFADVTSVNTVYKVLNTLIEKSKIVENQVTTISNSVTSVTNSFRETQTLAQNTANGFLTLQEEFSDYKDILGNYEEDMGMLASSISSVEIRTKQYTDEKALEINNHIDTIDSTLENIDQTMYRKSEVDSFVSELEAVDSNMQTDLTTLTGRVSNIESTRYTKTETDRLISTAVSSLVESAPETLDTLNELAAALNDNANFGSEVVKSLSEKAELEDFNTLNNIVTNGQTGLVTIAVDHTNAINDIVSNVTRIDTQINEDNGLADRVETLEFKYEQDIDGEYGFYSIRERFFELETLVNQHAATLERLSDVAFSGRYDHLLGLPFIPNKYYKGQSTFNSIDGREIPVPADFVSETASYGVTITPYDNPKGMLGEIWVTKTKNKFKVFCSGSTRTLKFDYVLFKID